MAEREKLTIPGEPRLSHRIREAAGRDKPCGVCPDCRKALRDIHPDVIMVTDPDHKNVSVDVLRRVASGASVLPNEGRRKVSIFPDCSLLDGTAPNVG